MSVFPELIGEATNGKSKMWSVNVFERDGCAVIQTIHGYTDGKKQTNEKIISEGKNIGKKNETTPLQQAINDARSSWTKKKESGYKPNSEYKPDSEDDEECITGRGKGFDCDVPSPMLAHDYNKRGKSIKFPCYVQRKLDGTRCVAIPHKGLFSRNRKQYPNLTHIIEEINLLPKNIILDGELYSDTLGFQEIVGLVKRETLKKDDDTRQLRIKFFVYDIINDMRFEERYANLQLLFTRYTFKYIELVKTEICASEEIMKEKHTEYVAEGYEGIILRNKSGSYKNTRSVDLQKYKCFEESEFKIVDYKEGEGLESGCVIWICENNDGIRFACRPRGTREERIEQFKHGKSYIGTMLTVIYQEMTDTNIPRFPVGKTIRELFE